MDTVTKTFGATYDGKILCPDEPLDLTPNTHVEVTIKLSPRPPVKEAGGVRKYFGSIDLEYATGTDNESIDRDLAREYGATHEDED